MGGGKIDCYIDSTSAYSQLALVHLRRNRKALESYGIEVEFHPVFLGGIMSLTGNKPPWVLKQKGDYLALDRQRGCKYYGVEYAPAPDFFPYVSVLPMRALLYIKSHHPRSLYDTIFLSLYTVTLSTFHPVNISIPSNFSSHLSQFFPDDPDEVQKIMQAANSKDYKDMLTAQTKMIVERYGAFGCPWMVVTNEKGQEECFFGSDRWGYVWRLLGVEWDDITVRPKGGGGGRDSSGAKL